MSRLSLPLEPAPAGDAGRAVLRVPPDRMRALGLRPGDTVAVEGTRRSHARVLPAAGIADRLGADPQVLRNVGLDWGAAAQVAPRDLPALEAARLRIGPPLAPSRAGALGDALADITLTEGDRLEIRLDGAAHAVAVVGVSPGDAGLVTGDTRIELERAAPARFAGIGGLERQIEALLEMVELPLRRPDLFSHLGIEPPRGVLFTGPPGSGKTMLARAVADAGAASFYHVAGPEIVSKHYGESEKALRQVFEAAAGRAPAIVFIDEIDAIAPRREKLSGERQVERRIVGQLLTLMDGLAARSGVVVMAATNLPDAIDPALRRPGRFDREIVFGPPGPAGREEILRAHLGGTPLSAGVDLAALAARCHGYVGADLAALAREAGLAALARARAGAPTIEAVAADGLEVTPADLERAFAATRPSVLRADAAAARQVSWSDVGGMEGIKTALTEAVIWPRNHPEAVRRLGLRPPRGILLAGAPGTGKTLLARALARESGLNFVPARPERLLSHYLGEAERAVADLFARARQSAPALLFFDEIDAFAPARGRGDAALDRVLAQFLTEIDGLEDNRDLTIIAATNRPEALDPALVRPGRFDLVLTADPPDAAARAEILAVHCRDRACADDLDLTAIARRTGGWTGAALAGLVAAAARHALVRVAAGGSVASAEVTLCQADLEAALADGGQVAPGARSAPGAPDAPAEPAAPGAQAADPAPPAETAPPAEPSPAATVTVPCTDPSP
jgi:transitional endoplasmic reticulum ATPase